MSELSRSCVLPQASCRDCRLSRIPSPRAICIATRFKTHRSIATSDHTTRADLAMTCLMLVNTSDTDTRRHHGIGPSSMSRNTRGRSGKLCLARFCASFLISASATSRAALPQTLHSQAETSLLSRRHWLGALFPTCPESPQISTAGCCLNMLPSATPCRQDVKKPGQIPSKT